MKAKMLFFLLFLSYSFVQAQSIEGVWWTGKQAAKVKIYKTSAGYYEGELIWTKDQSEKIKATHGSIVIRNLVKESETKYKGNAYDPEGKKTYGCNITVKDANNIDLRGYLGISLLGKTEQWTRATDHK